MSKRTASVNVTPEPVTWEEMQTALEKYVGAYCEIERVEAEAKAQVEKLKKEVAAKLKPLEKKLATHQEVVQTYAIQHKTDFNVVRKITVYGGHKIGFQTTPPAVQYCKPTGGSGKQDEKGFIAACKAVGDWAMSFIRKVEETNKDQVLEYHRKAKAEAEEAGDSVLLEVAEARLAKLGVKVTGGECVVIDLNLTPEGSK